ncbi:MAG TPA: hypothetical protein VIH18_11290 [Candidatus Binatia bacterium]|jgi:hypothetical protein
MTVRLCMLLAALLVTTECCNTGGAQTAKDNAGGMAKVAVELRSVYDEYSTYVASHQGGVFQPTSRLVRVVDDRVVIDAVAAGDVDVLKSDLESLGMRHAVAFGRTVSGELPIAAIRAMGALPSLNFARAASALLQGGPR